MPQRVPEKEGLYDPSFEHDACGVGFVAHIKGASSRDIIDRGLEVLVNMGHRGAAGADHKTGDGAGIILQIPHRFFSRLYPQLPPLGTYGTGLVFLPKDPQDAEVCTAVLEQVIEEEGQTILFWRDVPVDRDILGDVARASEPTIRQIFIGKGSSASRAIFERTLYVIRKRVERTLREKKLAGGKQFYIPSLSSHTIIYKGLLLPEQVHPFFLDLSAEDLESAVALVHSRFSTNTFPTWDLAQPFRFLAHNGEINTIKGNILKMEAREGTLFSEAFGEDLAKTFPVIRPHGSDSATLDNALELLVASGFSLPHAVMMLIPEAWNEQNPIPDHRRAFYEYASIFMEPWDGPATVAFTDGRVVGATLDRNGLRPARYVVTKDDLIVFASEVGVQSFAAERILYKGRLYPGKMLLLDLEEGRLISDDEVKDEVVNHRPYREWLNQNRIVFEDLVKEGKGPGEGLSEARLRELQLLFGYNLEDVSAILEPMAKSGEEPVGSMGTDTPLAVLSDQPQRLFNYFKQLFAQVTNPPIDPIRELMVMSLTSFIGPQGNILTESPEHCRTVKVKVPILSDAELKTLTEHADIGFKTLAIPAVFPYADGPAGLQKALDRICKQADEALAGGYQYICLSDRSASRDQVPIPSLLACGAVHHHLIRKRTRSKVSLLIETGEAREVMHIALLFGYGADVVNPYVALATAVSLSKNKIIDVDPKTAEKNCVKALAKGLLKVMSKMGISTLRSYRGAQLFEALGIHPECIDRYFCGTVSRIGGMKVEDIGREALVFHERAYRMLGESGPVLLPSEGVYRYRVEGERHAWNPDTISLLQQATRKDDAKLYEEYAKLVNRYNRENGTLRGFFDFKPDRQAISVDAVEPVVEILKRFVTGAMSFGSISRETHESLAVAMNKIGGKSNTGEGGEDSGRFKPRPDGTSARSAIKQIASARFGVTYHYLRNADEIQIKIAQGAKPGEGGQLPGHKVNDEIARLRHSTPGVSLISPPPHHDIYSIEDLKQLIFDLKHVNPKATVSVKLVAEVGVGTVAAGVAKAGADTVNVSGYDGGTGASPISSIKHAGVPWELGVAETQQTLVLNHLRGWVRLHTDGQMKTGRDVVIAALLGADEFAFSTAPLITLGCIMMRKCHLNTCPVGVATQDPELRRRFSGSPDYVIRFFYFVAEEIRTIMASLGVAKFDDLVGRTDFLTSREGDSLGLAWKRKCLDFSNLLYKPQTKAGEPIRYMQKEPHGVPGGLDEELLRLGTKLFDKPRARRRKGNTFDIDLPIRNVERAVGAMLSGEISERFGEVGLPEDSICCRFTGTAGQSFGAFLAPGIRFVLEGDSNDYLGKGLSGGHIVVRPPRGSTFIAEKNVIVGNTVLYGATAGEVFVRGMAGERFCVRNSGVTAVVEGVGDHGCEYMTGGCVVVLGRTGRNFAAGMSGGIVFVLDRHGDFSYYCNQEMVDLVPVSDSVDRESLKAVIAQHLTHTESDLAKSVLEDWELLLPKFVKLVPREYKRALAEQGLQPLFRYPPVREVPLREVARG